MKRLMTMVLALTMTFGAFAQNQIKTHRLSNDKMEAVKNLDPSQVKKHRVSDAKTMNVTITDIVPDALSVQATITPNEDVVSYLYVAADTDPNSMFSQYLAFFQMFGMTETDAIMALADNADAPATGTQTVTMGGAGWMTPGVENTIYVVTLDANDQTQLFTQTFTAGMLGGEGDAAVTVVVPEDSITYSSIYVSMTPNDQTSYFYYELISSDELTAMNWTNDSVVAYLVEEDYKAYTHAEGRFSYLDPNTEYHLFTLAYNINGVTLGLQDEIVSTSALGGEGTATVTVTMGTVTTTSAEITMTPNDQAAYFYYLIADDAVLQENGLTTDAAIQTYLEGEDEKNFEALSGTLNNLSMNTTYKVYAIAYNMNNVAGSMTMQEFTTESAGGSGEAVVDVDVTVGTGTVNIVTTMNTECAYYYFVAFYGVEEYDDETLIADVDGNAQRIQYEDLDINLEISAEEGQYAAVAVPYNGNNEQGNPVVIRFDVNGLLSLTEVNSTSLSVYPNPASSVVTVSNASSIERVEIVNLLGQKVYENATLGGTTAQINVSSLENGSYVLRVYSENGVKTSKLIVR